MFPSTAPLAPVIDTQKTLAYDQLFLCWRLPQDSAQAWHFSVEYQRQAGGAAATWGGLRSANAATAWQHLDEVRGTSAVVDRLQINSVYVLRVRGCNKAGFGEYSEEVYLRTPPAPGETRARLKCAVLRFYNSSMREKFHQNLATSCLLCILTICNKYNYTDVGRLFVKQVNAQVTTCWHIHDY